MESKTNAVYNANRKYEKNNYYIVSVRFPKTWEHEIKKQSDGKIQKFIIDCVGKVINKEYNPSYLIERKKREKQEREIIEA